MTRKVKSLWQKANALLTGNIIITVIAVAIIASLATATAVHNSQTPSNAISQTQPQQLSAGSSNAQSGLNPANHNTYNGSSSSGTKSNSSYFPTSTSTVKPYVAPVCTKTPTPYKTSYFEATWLGAGVLSSYGGTDGYTETCTADSNGYTPIITPLNPVNKVFDVGDGGASLATPIHDGETYDEVYYNRALPACDNLLAATNNDLAAKQWCIDNIVAAILHYYGY